MMELDLIVTDELLSTTRAIRKRMDLERPVPRSVIAECVRLATQAPTAGNSQGWNFVVITDPDLRAKAADIYRRAGAVYLREAAETSAEPQTKRVYQSASYLADVLDQVPVLVIPCIEGRVEGESTATAASLYGSIIPAAWSFALALRARGIGTAWTTIHLVLENEMAALLGIPANFTQVAMIAVGWITGNSLRPAIRGPVENVMSWDGWTHPSTADKA